MGILLSVKSALSVVSSASSALPASAREIRRCKNRIALALPFAQYPPMLARVLSAAVNGIEAFPVEVEVNSGWGDTIVVLIISVAPIPEPIFLRLRSIADFNHLKKNETYPRHRD
jgi:hypothetical protein